MSFLPHFGLYGMLIILFLSQVRVPLNTACKGPHCVYKLPKYGLNFNFIFSNSSPKYGSFGNSCKGSRNRVQRTLRKFKHDVQRFVILTFFEAISSYHQPVLNDVLDLYAFVLLEYIHKITHIFALQAIEWTAGNLNRSQGFVLS
jgi:hypothetical protein